MDKSFYEKLLKWAIESKSPWVILASLVVGLVSAIVSIVFVYRARKLEKAKVELLKKEEALEQKKEDAKIEESEEKIKELKEEAQEAAKTIKELGQEVYGLELQLIDTIDALSSAVSWEDLP